MDLTADSPVKTNTGTTSATTTVTAATTATATATATTTAACISASVQPSFSVEQQRVLDAALSGAETNRDLDF